MATLKVLSATWNAGNAAPTELSPWLPKGGGDYTLISVALQECLYKDKKGSHVEDTTSPRSESSTALLEEDSDDEVEAADGSGAAPAAVELLAAETAAAAEPAAAAPPTPGPSSSPHKEALAASTHPSFRSKLASGVVKNVMRGNENAPIVQLISAHLGADFEVLRSIMMFQTGLVVYVRKTEAARVKGTIEVDMEATGILGVGQNKGGLAIGLDFDGTRLLFLGAHLAAHMKHLAQRNSDVAEILNNIRLGGDKGARSLVETDQQFHHVVFAGDLNYRVDLAIARGGQQGIDEPDHRAAVRALIESGDIPSLIAADQLKWSQRENKAWHGFREADIAFQPTFTMLRQPGNVYAPKRVSSYCDRVLWKSLPGYEADVTCKSYTSYPEIASSDHKPVAASFEIAMRGPSDISALSPRAMSLAHDDPSLPRLVFPGGIEAKGLLALDYTGKSDPYVLFHSEPANLFASKAASGGAGKLLQSFFSVGSGRNQAKAAASTTTGASTNTLVSPTNSAPTADAAPSAAATDGAASPLPSPQTGGAAESFSPSTERGEGSAAAFLVPKSKVKSQTLNPKWSEGELPGLPLRITEPSALERASVILVLMDADIADAHDRMGSAVISLKDFASMPKQGPGSSFSVPFSVPVVKNSVAHGTISGRMQIIWPGVADAATSTAEASTAPAATTAAAPAQAVMSPSPHGNSAAARSPSEVNEGCWVYRNCTVQ